MNTATTLMSLRLDLASLIEERAHLAEVFGRNGRLEVRIMLSETDFAIEETYEAIAALEGVK